MILFIDTTNKNIKIALLSKDGTFLVEKDWISEQNELEVLISRINKMISEKNLSFSDLQGIVVIKGPGSYTGIRLGLSTANALALARNIPLVGLKSNFKKIELIKVVKNIEKVAFTPVLPYYGSAPKIKTAGEKASGC